MPLNVGIVGAGIAGLSAAVALRRAGAQVEIFEKSTFSGEIGAGITITPNATRLLERWGFAHEKAGGVPQLVRRHFKYDTLELFASGSLEEVPQMFGSPFTAYHRADLHKALSDLAQGDGPGLPAVVHLANKVVELGCDDGDIVLDDGKRIRKDLIVVASGQWSDFPGLVAQPLTPRGAVVYRTLIPMAEIQQEPSLAALFEPESPGFRFIHIGRGTVVMYYCRSGTLVSLALYHIVPPSTQSTLTRDWNVPASVEEVLAAIPPDLHPDFALLLRKGETYAAFTLPTRPQLETFAKGRAVVLGDAAHLMMPSHAQGATLAIEEAGSLAVFCEHATPEQLPQRVQQWNEFIRDHALTVQDLSNAMVDPEAYERAKARSKKPVFPQQQTHYSPPIWDFFFGNDLETAARDFLNSAQLN